MEPAKSTEQEVEAEAVNFGKSILVPSVQELAKQPIFSIPPRYAREDSSCNTVSDGNLPSVPLINFQRLNDRGKFNDEDELVKLHRACQEWGFFQVVNHGVDLKLVEEFKEQVESLFMLDYEEKQKLWQKPDNHEGFGQLFVVSDQQKLDWSDMFYITTLPQSLRQNDLFDKLPPILRESMETYSKEMKSLAMGILGHMSKALKMDGAEIKEMFGEGVQSIRMNYYPPCPEPDKAIGFTPHSDADALTILLQLNEADGLQIKKEGKWVLVRPLPNAFVVNIGDIMEVVTNGIYKSIEHRAIVNSSRERLSVATFYSCKLDCMLGPSPSLINQNTPAMFRTVPVESYFKDFFARKLNGKSYLDLMRIAADGETNN